MAYPEHQPYWFRAGSGCGLAGLAMIALTGALASSNGRFDATGLLAIIGYVLLALAVACFVSGVRKWRFPLASGDGHVGALTTPAPLRVTSGRPHYHDWSVDASVAALPVKVTNKTGEPVTLPGGCTCEMHGGDAPSWLSSLRGSGMEPAFSSEVESQRRTSHHQPDIRERTTIPAHASLELWFVTGIGRDYRGLRPRMTIHFNDGDGNKYAAAFGQQDPGASRRARLTMRRKP